MKRSKTFWYAKNVGSRYYLLMYSRYASCRAMYILKKNTIFMELFLDRINMNVNY